MEYNAYIETWGKGKLSDELTQIIRKKVDEIAPVDASQIGKYLKYDDFISIVRSAFYSGAEFALTELCNTIPAVSAAESKATPTAENKKVTLCNCCGKLVELENVQYGALSYMYGYKYCSIECADKHNP